MTTSGAFYTITFFLVMSGGPPNSFSVSWGGVTLLSLTDHQQPFDYTEFTFNVPASDSSTELLFQFNTTGSPPMEFGC